MIDVIRDAENRFFNTVSLNSLLRKTDMRFRTSVIGALIMEGFELDESLPCLQYPLEILESIHWLESLDFGITLESFRQALLAAGKIGILMDVSMRDSKAMQAAPSIHSGWGTGAHLPQLETA